MSSKVASVTAGATGLVEADEDDEFPPPEDAPPPPQALSRSGDAAMPRAASNLRRSIVAGILPMGVLFAATLPHVNAYSKSLNADLQTTLRSWNGKISDCIS